MAYFGFLFFIFWPMVASSFPDRNPVHAREPLITQAPQINEHPLLARGDVSTCGFVSGDVSMSPSPPSLSRLFQLTCTTTLPRITTYMSHELLLHVYGTIFDRMGLLQPNPMCRQLPHLRGLRCSDLCRWSRCCRLLINIYFYSVLVGWAFLR